VFLHEVDASLVCVDYSYSHPDSICIYTADNVATGEKAAVRADGKALPASERG
jgi:hypothetical protein